MAAIECAREHGVLHFESLGDRACSQQFELQSAARHVIDARNEVRRKLMKNVLGGPGALKLEGHGFLRARHIWHGKRRSTRRCGNGATLQEFPTRVNV